MQAITCTSCPSHGSLYSRDLTARNGRYTYSGLETPLARTCTHLFLMDGTFVEVNSNRYACRTAFESRIYIPFKSLFLYFSSWRFCPRLALSITYIQWSGPQGRSCKSEWYHSHGHMLVSSLNSLHSPNHEKSGVAISP